MELGEAGDEPNASRRRMESAILGISQVNCYNSAYAIAVRDTFMLSDFSASICLERAVCILLMPCPCWSARRIVQQCMTRHASHEARFVAHAIYEQ